MIPWFRTGKAGWIALAAFIIAWDMLAEDEQTLSESFRRGWHRHPATMGAVALAWGVVTAHLWNLLPPRADPLHVICVARQRWRPHAVAA